MGKKLFLFGFLLIFGLVNQVFALTITNSDFEDGLNGWDVSDINGAKTTESVSSYSDEDVSGTTYTSPFGNYFAELTGTASISQTISWSAGDTITFYWAFLGFDEDADYAYYTIDGGEKIILAYISSNIVEGDVTVDVDGGHVGWLVETTIEFSEAGSGLLVFGVSNYYDEATGSFEGLYDSKLLIDMAAVPEPATLILLGFGLLVIAGIGRKKIFQ